MLTKHTRLASFPGPFQHSVACSTEKIFCSRAGRAREQGYTSYTRRKQSVQRSEKKYMLITASLDKRTESSSSTDSFNYGKPDLLAIATVALRHCLEVE